MSPQTSLILSLLPDSLFPTLLRNLEGVNEPTRAKLGELEKKGDWKGIIALAQQSLEKDPNNADWYTILGFAHSQLGDYPRAAEAFQRAIRLEPDEIQAWNLLAQAQRSMGQPERAVQTLDQAMRINQNQVSPITYYLLGESFVDLKRPDRAVGYYEQAIASRPSFVEALYRAGLAYAYLGRKSDFDFTVQRLRLVSPAAADQLMKTAVASRAPSSAGGAPGDLPTERRSPK